ncbi:MAG: hypothetical protein JO011_00895, partial [Ktedonobacteraceae bacterium]|nr:hypothetical protein [Ktedonobacteraceae bacterium]
MNTIRCSECGELLPASANYCRICGTAAGLSLRLQSDDQWAAIRRSVTWRKEVALSPNRANPAPLPPRPARSRPPMWNTWRRIRYRISPTVAAWRSLLVFPIFTWRSIRSRFSPTVAVWISLLVFVIFGSIFGIAATRGSGISSHSSSGLALQVSPDNVAVGATVMLNGAHFNPYGKIGLTRDASIPIQDTANATIIEADSNGNFTDTLVITPDWEAGPHTINAEDAFRHKTASFSIMVTGHTTSFRPAHLRISVDKLDLGSGNQAANTVKTITLTNIGSGLISWQASGSESWLVLSPAGGTLASSHSAQVMVAIDRSKLRPGSYKGQINIFSTAGNSIVPVTAAVTVLVPGHNAVLQTDPALLSFTAIDGGASPSTQTITVSNPGVLPLQWQVTTNTNWLSVSPQSALVDPSGSLPVTVSVNSSLLLPGTYTGAITFNAQGSVMNSPQTIFVTVTITPQCSAVAVPGQLSFASIYQQGAPPAKVVSIGASQGCSTSGRWQAASNASWLTLDTTSGQTPGSLRVGVNVSGLLPGVYTSSIVLSSAAGTQTLPVTFTLGHAPVPLVTTAPAAISFNGVAGQSSATIQKISIMNSGNTGPLNWYATASGGNWLSVYPSSGIVMTHQSISFNITGSVLPGMVPGIYTGTVSIIGIDSFGHPALGSPQVIPVSLLVKPACTFTVAPGTLNLIGISGQSAPINQQIALQASSSCTNRLNWTATTDGSWLSASVVGNSVSVSAALAHLTANNYSGTVTITAHDSVTNQPVGTPRVLPISLTAQPACALHNLSSPTETFDAKAGSNPAAPQTFTISVTGTCSGAVTIAPSIIFNRGTGWVTAVTNTSTIHSGESATFTVTVTSIGLAAGQYEATIQISGLNGGITMMN